MDAYLTRQTLLLRAKNSSDDVAWAELLSIYKNFIYVIIRAQGISNKHADDVFQSVSLSLWEKLNSYDNKHYKFRNWLAKVTRNKAIDFIRKETSHLNKIDKLQKSKELDNESDNDFEQRVEENWKLFISNMAIDNISKKLASNDFACFQLFADGISQKEIAEQLCLKLPSVYKSISRTKVKLYQEIQVLKRELDI